MGSRTREQSPEPPRRPQGQKHLTGEAGLKAELQVPAAVTVTFGWTLLFLPPLLPCPLSHCTHGPQSGFQTNKSKWRFRSLLTKRRDLGSSLEEEVNSERRLASPASFPEEAAALGPRPRRHYPCAPLVGSHWRALLPAARAQDLPPADAPPVSRRRRDTLTEGPGRNVGGPVRGGLFTVYVVPIKHDPVTPGAALSVHPLRKTAT